MGKPDEESGRYQHPLELGDYGYAPAFSSQHGSRAERFHHITSCHGHCWHLSGKIELLPIYRNKEYTTMSSVNAMMTYP